MASSLAAQLIRIGDEAVLREPDGEPSQLGESGIASHVALAMDRANVVLRTIEFDVHLPGFVGDIQVDRSSAQLQGQLPPRVGQLLVIEDMQVWIRRCARSLTFRRIAISQCAPSWTKTAPASWSPHNV
jgi:hypothetical protein